MNRRPRPSRRRNTTYAFKVGVVGVHLTLSRYDDGALMEVFIDVNHAEGSTTRALMGAIARLISTGLQHGVELGAILDQLMDTKFAPDGLGAGHAAIEGHHCTSLLDACGRILKYDLKVSGTMR